MTIDDDFLDDDEDDKTMLRPRPGGSRRPAAPQQPPAQPAPGQAPPGATQLRSPQQQPPQQPAGQAPMQPAAPQPPPVQQAAVVPSLDSIRGAGASALATAASPLLVLMSQIRGLPAHADVNGLHQQVIGRIQKFEADANNAGVPSEQIISARYALCAAIDETVLSTPWGSDSIWSTHTLLTTFHKETWGGEKFFQILERLKANAHANIDLLELMYLCLALGFEGKYKIQERGQIQLANIMDETYRLIRQVRGEMERGLSPHWRGVEDKRNPLVRYVPLWVVASVLVAVLLGIFISFRFSLARAGQPIDEVLSGIGVQDFTQVASVATPSVRLKPLLAGPEAAGQLNVTEKGGVTIVTLQGDNLFASGSAEVNQEYETVLRQVGQALEQVSGPVRVVGHSDNVPIRSFRFQSNWELSRERAIDVAEILAGAMSTPTRLIPQGVADTLPVSTNDTPEGRALNRRVEIIHTAQGAAQ